MEIYSLLLTIRRNYNVNHQASKERLLNMLRHFELVGEFSSGRVDLSRRAVLEDRRDELKFEHYADDWAVENNEWRYSQ